jgi:hypothetical protein
MCGRYGRRADKQRIAEWFHTHNTDVFNDEYYEINSTRLAPPYNIAPDSIQPAVRFDHETGERVLAVMKWGLVPYWIPLANSIFFVFSSWEGASRNTCGHPWRGTRRKLKAELRDRSRRGCDAEGIGAGDLVVAAEGIEQG